MSQASSQMQAFAAQKPSGVIDALRKELGIDAASYAYRVGARQEELRVYELASYASVETSVIPLLPPLIAGPFHESVAALHSLYILSGIDQYYLVNVHFIHPYGDAPPMSSLLAYYKEAEAKYAVNWSYFASINYIESNFGRVLGPSSAGAIGPMQFEPGTWVEYGQGGNINDSHDSILAAARLLVANGAHLDIRTALWHYNNDYDYVDSVESFARAFRTNPEWFAHMYYWNTYG